MTPRLERYFSHHRASCCDDSEEKIVNDSPDDGRTSPANDGSLYLYQFFSQYHANERKGRL